MRLLDALRTLEDHLQWRMSFLLVLNHARPIPIFQVAVVLTQQLGEDESFQLHPDPPKVGRGRGGGGGRRGRGGRGAAQDPGEVEVAGVPLQIRGRGRGRRGRGGRGVGLLAVEDGIEEEDEGKPETDDNDEDDDDDASSKNEDSDKSDFEEDCIVWQIAMEHEFIKSNHTIAQTKMMVGIHQNVDIYRLRLCHRLHVSDIS